MNEEHAGNIIKELAAMAAQQTVDIASYKAMNKELEAKNAELSSKLSELEDNNNDTIN